MLGKLNRWYDSPHIAKSGASLKYDAPLDDMSTIDLRFVKKFIFRAIQCMCMLEKWEKLASIGASLLPFCITSLIQLTHFNIFV